MSEQRFTLVEKGNCWVVDDNTRKKFYLTPNEVVDLLNEQQATINKLQKWVQAEQKQSMKRDAFLKEKGLFREFCEKMAQNL